MRTILENLDDGGIAVIGTPNIAMAPFQSEETKKVHINMFDEMRLYNLCHGAFHNVFIFNMNDEVINTGFDPMSCYFFALCCNPRNEKL